MIDHDPFAAVAALKDTLVEIVCILQNAVDNRDPLHAGTGMGALLGLVDTQHTNGTGSVTEFDLLLYAAFGTNKDAGYLIDQARDHDHQPGQCELCRNLATAYDDMVETACEQSAARRRTKEDNL